MDWKYPATQENVEQVCSAAEQAFEKHALNRKDRFALNLLLREALNNAVLHGCQKNPLLTFSCRLLFSDHEVIIEVSDEGAGFDWHKKPAILTDNSADSGRGLPIYAIYAQLTKFNDAGNCVTLKRIINGGEKDG
ncbi:MAG: ATP-binding protein [Leptolinea sp.]